jgi:outer membrane murein-binding lipoprotein Lpp
LAAPSELQLSLTYPRLLVSVLVPRQRTIGVRLSEAEYTALERFCVGSGARSISDLARIAISSYLNRGTEESSLTLAVSQNAAQVKDLEEKIARLSSEIAQLRAASPAGAGPGEGEAG